VELASVERCDVGRGCGDASRLSAFKAADRGQLRWQNSARTKATLRAHSVDAREMVLTYAATRTVEAEGVGY